MLLDLTLDYEADPIVNHGFNEANEALAHVFLHKAAVVALSLRGICLDAGILRHWFRILGLLQVIRVPRMLL